MTNINKSILKSIAIAFTIAIITTILITTILEHYKVYEFIQSNINKLL